MARISLRAYNREIESLIESSQVEQAISHCRHILKFYPKHVETYRLLGKAYLESRRYGDAGDILQRVLSSVPEDFVAHVGMSIIREDEGNLDEAIWHMERAFEMQPANSAIQEELRRLYGQRDGLEPPKVRLTRGALARMYAKGELHQQAIAELRSILANDPQRLDLQLLLAQVYARSGQRAEAAETCSLLLRKLPYCLEANRIMADILASSERSEETKAYQMRVQALDPYASQISVASPSRESVPDQAISLEKLDWKPGQIESEQGSQPAWATSLGVELEEGSPSKDVVPDWLSAATEGFVDTQQEEAEETAFQETSPEKSIESQAGSPLPAILEEEDQIPDWMKDAGWTPATGEAEAGPVDQEPSIPTDLFTGEIEGTQDLESADIPDWLKAIAPTEEGVEGADLGLQEQSDLSWLPGPETTEETPEWLSEAVEEAPAIPVEAKEEQETAALQTGGVEETPSKEQGSTTAETQAEAPVLPDWLQGLPGEEKETVGEETEPPLSLTAEEPLEETGVAETSDKENLPDWLKEIIEEPASEEEIETETPATWLEEEPVKGSVTGDTQPTKVSTTLQPESEEVAEIQTSEDELPDWLKELKPETAALKADQVTEQAETIAEEEPTEFETPSSEWQIETKPAPEEEAASIETEAKEADLQGQISEKQPDEEIDEGFAWLESLAARQGADEAMLLKPEERMETPPEWIQELADQEQTSAEEVETLTAGEETEAGGEEIASESSAITQEEVIELELGEESTVQSEVEAPAEETGEVSPFTEDEDAAFAWLESLAVKQGADEALLLNPEERQEAPPEWVQEAQKETTEQAETTNIEEGEPPIVEETSAPEMPEWLRNLAEEEAVLSVEPAADLEKKVGLEEQVEVEEQVEQEEQVDKFEAEEEIPTSILEEITESSEEEEFQVEEYAKEQLEDIPELPDWLAESTVEAGEEEDVIWLPPVSISQRLNLNEAALVELEKLPNIGFILAQNIISYRDTFGPFKQIEDLENVAGIGPATLEELKDYIFIEPSQQLESVSPIPDRDLPTEVQKAHDELLQGNLEDAVTQYSHLIKSRQYLDDVIQDLQTALYQNPVEVSLWQTLGDAYLRADQVQEALDAYTKAEELLR
jgi:competence ComEA-like helix-hairpin-helix protein